MANIKELIQPHKILYKTLKCAGNLGEDLGLECYVVGGAVRDLFLHRKIMEVDIMVVGWNRICQRVRNPFKSKKDYPF